MYIKSSNFEKLFDTLCQKNQLKILLNYRIRVLKPIKSNNFLTHGVKKFKLYYYSIIVFIF